VPYYLYWGPWGSTWERWAREGYPEGKSFRDLFDTDCAPASLDVHCGPVPAIEQKVLSEDDDYVVHIDSWGIRRRDYKGGMSMSEFLEFPVKDRQGWEAFRDRYLNPDDPRRLDGDWREQAKEMTANGRPIQLGGYPDVGIFGTLRWLLGDEECLISFYTQPDLVHDIMDHMTDVYLTVFGKVLCEARVDVIHMWEDFCGRQGSLISPAHWDEFIAPCYRRIKTFSREHDIPILSVDTDGQPDGVIPVMMKAGVNYLFPFEVAAGCDVNVFGRRYPKLAMMGGIDKRALAVGPEAIDRELDRILPAVRKGRYIPDLDHLIPDDVSWPNFCHYARGLKKRLAETRRA
jgi:uroporphyrinogen decarboxylase